MARALFYTGPKTAELREVVSQPVTEPCAVTVRTLWSGLSRGTERLVFEGRVPETEFGRMRAPFQEGAFPFPVKYGYASVGVVEQGPDAMAGKPVFCLFPHQDRYSVPCDTVTVLPDGLPPRRAILAANMETALNAMWDSGAGPGDRVAIVGGGVLGGLLAGLCGSMPGTEVTLIDTNPDRASLADHMNVRFGTPENSPEDCDVVFHTSATESGAGMALACAGTESRVVELSWYGDARPALPLGGAFHSKRLSYVSSQVGQVAPSRRSRWSHSRRLTKALELLGDERYDALITGEVAFGDLPDALPGLLAADAPGLATAIRY